MKGGVVDFTLEGEDPGLVAGAVATKRINEYYRLLWRGRRGMTPFNAWAVLSDERKEKL